MRKLVRAIAQLQSIPPKDRTPNQVAIFNRLVNQQKEIQATVTSSRAELRMKKVSKITISLKNFCIFFFIEKYDFSMFDPTFKSEADLS